MTALHRRDQILDRIEARCSIVYTGFVLDHKPSPCHLWTGPDSGTGRGGGYGRVWIKGKRLMVHRVTFEHFSGPIEDGLVLDHLCRIRKCCNPAHLDPVTIQENTHRGNAVLFQRIAA